MTGVQTCALPIWNSGTFANGNDSIVPGGVTVGKNTVISGKTVLEDYPDGQIVSGKTLIKAGEER